ncbi:unnamed protein product, partial [Ixodes hexagonus]
KDNSTVVRSVASCHDRTFGFLVNYTKNLGELEEKLRLNVRMLIDDVSLWNNEIGMISRELRAATSPGSPSSATQAAAARRTQSADMLRIPTAPSLAAGATPASPGPHPTAGFKLRDGRPPLLLPKDRSHHKPLVPYIPEHGASRLFRQERYSVDRDMEEVDVFNAVRVPSPGAGSPLGSTPFPPLGSWDTSRDPVPKLGRQEDSPGERTPKLEPRVTVQSEPLSGQPGPEPPVPRISLELPPEAIALKAESKEQETKNLNENISDGQLVVLAEENGESPTSGNDTRAGSSPAGRVEAQETSQAQGSSCGQSQISDNAGGPPPDESSKDTEGT